MPRLKGSKNKKKSVDISTSRKPIVFADEGIPAQDHHPHNPCQPASVPAKVEDKRVVSAIPEQMLAAVIMTGDLSKLNPEQKVMYYKAYCERVGLDPVTKPFELLNLKGREILYCTRSGTQQLSALHKVSHQITDRKTENGIVLVSCRATAADGRYSESIGAVSVDGMKGDMLCNNYMKAETKAKRRATLDLLGLGILDESEIETIKDAKIQPLQEAQTPSVTHVQPSGEAHEGVQVKQPTEQLELVKGKICKALELLRETEYIKKDALDRWYEKAMATAEITVMMNLYKEVLAQGGIHKTFMITKIRPALEATIKDEVELHRAVSDLKTKDIKGVYSIYLDVVKNKG